MRGRFVVGPVLHHEFGKSGFFVAATGQLVGWLRNPPGPVTQINVDDLWGQVGGPLGSGHWDLQVGRFMTWRVYHKGLGFDLYTLEDNGALATGHVSDGSATYGAHTYEVNYLYYRQGGLPFGDDEFAGKAALHYYPTRFLGFEFAGAYGQAGGGKMDSLGGRLAADLHKNFGPVGVRVSAAAEDRYEVLAVPQVNNLSTDPNAPLYKDCPDCFMRDNKGLGGGAVVKAFIVEVGAGFAEGWDLAHLHGTNTVGQGRDLPNSGVRVSYGGYLQLDPGKLVLKRSLIIGAGLQHNEEVRRTHSYSEALQGAAYVVFPLGFNDASLKFVLSRAELQNFARSSADGAPLEYNEADTAMTAARLRFAYYF